ncbi:MAG: hydroxymethylbilane synthase [Alphaproteobacteria bacterium]|nr:hydroxymethylbilane synthase [Alphaproteobacteria bacterium]
MRRLRLATRGSKLALWQAEAVRDALLAAHPGLPEPEIVVVTTTGDVVRDRPLAQVGGKGVFTREIDRRLLDGEADIAVHSMKDVETELTPGTILPAMLPREDAREAFLSPVADSPASLPRGAVVGSSSIRRRAQLLAARPDLEIVLYRGNVDTRLAKLKASEVAATLLALAGLKRLGRAGEVTRVLSVEEMLPPAGQGAVGITCRADDTEAVALLAAIDHAPTHTAVAAERAVLARLDGSCRTPIAAHATLDGGRLALEAMVLSGDGTRAARGRREGPSTDAVALGDDLGRELAREAGPDLFGSREA